MINRIVGLLSLTDGFTFQGSESLSVTFNSPDQIGQARFHYWLSETNITQKRCSSFRYDHVGRIEATSKYM